MKSEEEIKQWLLENCINEYGNLDLSFLDFSEFDGSINISYMKVKKNLKQASQTVGGNLFQGQCNVKGRLWQSAQKVGKELRQGFSEVEGNLCQNGHKVKGILWQRRQNVGENLFQNEQTVKGKLYKDDIEEERK